MARRIYTKKFRVMIRPGVRGLCWAFSMVLLEARGVCNLFRRLFGSCEDLLTVAGRGCRRDEFDQFSQADKNVAKKKLLFLLR